MNLLLANFMNLILEPWPWYVAGPLIGLTVPAMFYLGNKAFGFSSNFRHACAMVYTGEDTFFKYDWKQQGGWNLLFLIGVALGGFIAVNFLNASTHLVDISANTKATLMAMGVSLNVGLIPENLFSVEALFTTRGFVVMVVGGFFVGFGARYAGGCTSGHAITGISTLQIASIIAVIGFFIGGLFATYVLWPILS